MRGLSPRSAFCVTPNTERFAKIRTCDQAISWRVCFDLLVLNCNHCVVKVKATFFFASVDMQRITQHFPFPDVWNKLLQFASDAFEVEFRVIIVSLFAAPQNE